MLQFLVLATTTTFPVVVVTAQVLQQPVPLEPEDQLPLVEKEEGDDEVVIVLDNSNIHTAIELWVGNFRDQAVVRELYGGPIEDWDTSRVTDMSHLFSCQEQQQQLHQLREGDRKTTRSKRMMMDFNPPIGRWNVERVTSMSEMFHSCTSFDQDLGNWNTSSLTDMSFMFHVSTIRNKDYFSYPYK